MEVVEALAPRAFTTHFKDMGLEEYREGFLLAEVPLGTGVLDLPRVVRILRAARPEIRFNLEMITRDPLKVPCLTERYWATFPDLPGRHLARTLSLVRDHPRDTRCRGSARSAGTNSSGSRTITSGAASRSHVNGSGSEANHPSVSPSNRDAVPDRPWPERYLGSAHALAITRRVPGANRFWAA